MATMHHSKNELRIKYEKLKHDRLLPGKIVFVVLIIASSVALFYVPLRLRGIFYGARFIAYPLLLYIICSSIYKLRTGNYGTKTEEEETLEASIQGEDSILSMLAELPDKIHVYTKVTVPWRNEKGKEKKSNTDIIVVSFRGITVIKVKGIKGTICGNADNNELVQQTWRGGRVVRKKTFYNPIQQVHTHSKALSVYLKEHGVNCGINECVFFTHNEVEVEIGGDTSVYSGCPVFIRFDKWKLFSYMLPKYGLVYSDEEIKQILDALDALVENPESK